MTETLLRYGRGACRSGREGRCVTIETARLHLREPDDGDVEALREYYRRNAVRFDAWGEGRRDVLEEHRSWVAERHAERRKGAPSAFLALDRESDATVAVVVLSGFSLVPPSAMLSYSVDGAYEGAGFASEAVGAVVDYAFATLGLRTISAHYDPENVRSERLLQRLGFREMARMGPLEMPHLRRRGQVLAVLERDPAGTGRSEA
jgi:[ribosomal protein S5]-alanine N-acetyltransferase